MNKLNQKEELTQSTLPLDKSENLHSIQKETKKLTRLPFYKLEELKKQEEKKAKQRHKVNKKEDILAPHSQILDKTEKSGKKKRIILKKAKDERVKIKAEEIVEEKKDSINVNTSKETNIDIKQKEVNKIPKIKTENYQVNKPPDHSGNSLKTLKYSADEIIHKKIKLSRKQRKLQEAENTLASFLSKEDKSTYYHNNSSNKTNKFVVHDEHHVISNHDKNYTPSSLNMSSMNNTNQNLNASHLNINTTVKKTDNNINLKLLGKKKKRINKFKKAVYKYRFKKKQFIFNNVFKLENENSNVIVDELIDSQKIIVPDGDAVLDTNLEKANNNLQNKSPLTINQPVEKSERLINSVTLNSNAKPNFIEKINFYSQDHQQGMNNIHANTNVQTSQISSTYNLDNTMNSNPELFNAYNYNNNYQNNFYQCNYPYNYPQYFYPYYPMNMYNNQQYFNHQAYNYSNNNAGSYYNKFNVNFAKIPTGHCNANNTNGLSNITPQIRTENTDAYMNMNNIKQGPQALKPKKKKNKNKALLNKFNNLDKKQIEHLNNNSKKEFLFEMAEKIEPNNDNIISIKPEEFKNFIKSSYHIDKDITNLNGIELNNYLKEHTMLKKVDLKNLQKIADESTINAYIKNFEGVLPDVNLNKRIIREYVDQMLDNELDKKFGDFIVKMRDMYHKKKQATPLKAKKRFVVGMREIEKHIRLDEVKCLFVVPNIEKVEGENSLDDKIYKIFKDCEIKKIPKIFGMNKFKLGKLSRKKYSCVSMLAFVNVEGFEREFRDLIEFAEKFRIKFYENYLTQKEAFKDNRFINMELFKNLEKPDN